MARIGVFGGSFDPIHAAHLILAEVARQERGLHKVLFVPARQSPNKKKPTAASAEDRLEMVRLAIEDNDAFDASAIELGREGPSYTLLTIRELKRRAGEESEFFLIVGADSVRDMPTWWRCQELVREVGIISLARPGHSLRDLDEFERHFGLEATDRLRNLSLAGPLLDLSATTVRDRISRGMTIRYFVPDAVRNYILEKGLYRAV